ncbi:MAG: hypothetical protein ACXV8R_07460 [Acidimicrobiia bacterium]
MKVADEEVEAPAPVVGTRVSSGEWAGRTLRFVPAVVISALVTNWVIGVLPNLLPAKTDIVGYPIHHPFDVRHYYAVFALWMVFFPALATLIYTLLGRVRSRRPAAALDRSFEPVPDAVEPLPDPDSVWPRVIAFVAAFAALLFATVPLALAVGVLGTARSPDFGAMALGAALATAVLGMVIALLVRALARVPASSAVWAVASVAAPGAFLALSLLSAQSGIDVTSTRSFRAVTWFPWWLGVPATILGVIVVVRSLRRRPFLQWGAIGRWAIVVCTTPTVLWMVVGRIQATATVGDLFHDGELLAGAQQLFDGRFPWRDFISTHGLLYDSVQNLVGFTLLEHSIWGAANGTSIWAVPIYWISSFAFAAYLFRRNKWLLIAWCALVVASPLAGAPVVFFPDTPLFVAHVRALLYPLILLSMAWLVRRPNPKRVGPLAFLLIVQVVVTPEMAFLVPALFVTLIAFDWTRHPGASFVRRFPTTLAMVLWCAGFGIVFSIYLQANGALGSFFDYFRIFAAGHELTGGIPIAWKGPVFQVSAYLPPVLFLVTIWYVISRVRGRRALERDDWVLAPAFFFSVLYYSKFLSRADVHSIHTFAIAAPLMWYVIARVLANADRMWSRVGAVGRLVPHGVTIVAVGVTVALLTPTLASALEDTPDHYRSTAQGVSSIPRFGYTNNDAYTLAYGRGVADADAVIHAIAPGDPKLFDFSNSPELFHFALGLRPPTRYFHVSMAIPQVAQRELIDELRKANPEVVAYTNPSGLEAWDGIPNMVRHYDVSRYLLTHYRPVVGVDRIVYLLRNDLPFDPASIDRLSLTSIPQFAALNQGPQICDWGAAPERFAPEPARGAKRSGPLALTPVDATVYLGGWAVDPVTGRPLPSVVALNAEGTVLASAVPGDDRPDVASLPGRSGALHSGFHLAVPVAAGEDVVVAGRRADGTLLPLDLASHLVGTVTAGTAVRVGRSQVPVASGTGGSVEQGERLGIPAGTSAARLVRPGPPAGWNWLRLRSPDALAAGSYTMGTPAGSGHIQFRIVSDSRRSIDVMVGACVQWYDDNPTTVLSYPASGPAPTVELIR